MSNERAVEQQESGAPAEDGSRHLADPVRKIDLAEQARDLREHETWQREGHNARTLVKNESLSIVLIDMHAGSRLGEHRTDSRFSLQVLTGKVSVSFSGRSYVVAAGQLLALGESIPHDVEVLEQSSFPLTLARERPEAGGTVGGRHAR